MNYRPSFMGSLPPVTKNLLIINTLFLLAAFAIRNTFGIHLAEYLGLHFPMAEKFNPIQLVTYMFMHADLSHLFFNMFAVFMFGRALEAYWGSKRYLLYYLITGVGAGLIHLGTQFIDIIPFTNAINSYMAEPSTAKLNYIISEFGPALSYGFKLQVEDFVNSYNQIVATDIDQAVSLAVQFLGQFKVDYLNAHITVGASGAVFGILLAFGMLFPDVELLLIFPPIPLKAKYFVIIYGVAELFLGVASFSLDNVAHWAHLGGMLAGFILIKYWKRKGIY